MRSMERSYDRQGEGWWGGVWGALTALAAILVGAWLCTASAGPYERQAREAWERALATLPPAPDPTPVKAGCLFLIVVEPEGERTPQTARVLTDRVLWSVLEAEGHRWRIIPYQDPICRAKGYDKLADKVDKPALLLLTTEGQPKGVLRLPADAAGVRNAVKEALK